jgi:hypothetical protein
MNMSPYKISKPGELAKAKITKIEKTTAGKVFTKKDTGEFMAKFSKPDDPVFVLHGIVEGTKEEIRLGTISPPKNPAGILYPQSKLAILLQRSNLPLDVVSEDLRELRGQTITLVRDSRGFLRV